jgi:hypothetical protein
VNPLRIDWCALVLCAALLPAVAGAAEQGEASVTLHSTITGNQEQPKVLHIVPWQPPGGVDQLQQPVQSLLGDVFAPTDRAEFRRELKYRAEAATATAAAPAQDAAAP